MRHTNFSLLTLCFCGALISGCYKKNITDASATMSTEQAQSIVKQLNAQVDTSINTLLNQDNSEYYASLENYKSYIDDTQTAVSLNAMSDYNLFKKVQEHWKTNSKNICSIVTPIFQNIKNSWSSVCVFGGIYASAGTIYHKGQGVDFVWDIYNHQFAAFDYTGSSAVFGSSSMGSAGVSGYVGMGVGYNKNVKSAWEGYFITGTIDLGLPWLANYLTVNASKFYGEPTQAKSESKPDLSTITTFGASVGITLSAGIPNPLPGTISLSRGNWVVSKASTTAFYNLFKNAGISVSNTGANTCGNNCLYFNQSGKKMSNIERNINVLKSIPVAMRTDNRNTVPQFNMWAVLAITLGIMQDFNGNLSTVIEACDKK